MAAQLARIETGMSDIAAAAAGNSHFREELRASLEQCDFFSGRSFRANDGGEKTRCATTCHHNIPLAHFAMLLHTRAQVCSEPIRFTLAMRASLTQINKETLAE